MLDMLLIIFNLCKLNPKIFHNSSEQGKVNFIKCLPRLHDENTNWENLDSVGLPAKFLPSKECCARPCEWV